jgi:hypothetical protein
MVAVCSETLGRYGAKALYEAFTLVASSFSVLTTAIANPVRGMSRSSSLT